MYLFGRGGVLLDRGLALYVDNLTLGNVGAETLLLIVLLGMMVSAR